MGHLHRFRLLELANCKAAGEEVPERYRKGTSEVSVVAHTRAAPKRKTKGKRGNAKKKTA